MNLKPGIYPDITNREYHADSALGSTSIKTLALKTPAHYQWDKLNPKHSDAFNTGTAVHELVLEGEFKTVVELEHDSYRSKAAQEDRDKAYADGLTPMLSKDLIEVYAMRDAVMRNPLAWDAFRGHIPEQSYFWEEAGQMFKVRPDALKPGLITDLKTCQSASPNEFAKTAYNFGYFISAALYVDGVKELTGEECRFQFVNVEKSGQYLTSVVELTPDALDYGRAMIDRAKRIHAECTESGNWPGYPAFTTVNLPMWANYEMDDLLGLSVEKEITF